MSKNINHYIFVYEIQNSWENDYLPEEYDAEILEYFAVFLAYHGSCDELIPISNTIVFGSSDTMDDLFNDLVKYFRKYTDFVFARIQPKANIDSGYKPRSNIRNTSDKREKLKNFLNKYKALSPKELVEKLNGWNI